MYATKKTQQHLWILLGHKFEPQSNQMSNLISAQQIEKPVKWHLKQASNQTQFIRIKITTYLKEGGY